MATHYIKLSNTNSSDIDNIVYVNSDEYRYDNTEAYQCCIVTACIKAKGLPDDCYELKTLRNFRDEYIKSLFDGKEIVSNYYDIASIILNKIYEVPNSNEIFLDIYSDLVLKSVTLIENNKNQQTFFYFKGYIDKLKKKYLLLL